ncbi:hypothetical protein C4544_00720 [candidate division WS5 bacterium]|uniref:Uncharacterized protein n=1 Tax=candidate division WS5 bacterium TaxID=2093353 RepID=A0A419DGH0_9BACT|nr:MAG: hypothetical protein C4544_00720 [candidate division WS5 bacterium]
MDKKLKYPIQIAIILVFALIYFLVRYGQKQAEEVYWKFNVAPDKPMTEFICKANNDYIFKTSGAIKKIYIDGIEHPGNSSTYIGFKTLFKKDTRIKLDIAMSGYFTSDGTIEIWKGTTQVSFPRLYVLKTDTYSDHAINVKKGTRFDVKRSEELYYAGYFRNGALAHEVLVKDKKDMMFQFYDDYAIKFRAGEVPTALIIPETYRESLTVTISSIQNRDRRTKELNAAYFIPAGQVITTPFWLDVGDEVRLSAHYIMAATSGAWQKIYGRSFYADSSGYLQIKAVQDSSVDRVHINHNKTWKLNISPDTSSTIQVYKGDILKSYSKSRYYADGKLMDRDTSNEHVVEKDGYIEFKSSIDPNIIEVRVVSRRGY